MGGLLPRGRKDSFDYVLHAADIAVEIYTSDPNFYRPLMRFLLGVPDPVHRPAFMKRAYYYWRVVVQALVETNLIKDGLEANDLARDFQVFFAGAIDFWVHDELDGPQFQAQIRHGMALRLLALGVESANDRLLRKIKVLRRVFNSPGFYNFCVYGKYKKMRRILGHSHTPTKTTTFAFSSFSILTLQLGFFG